MRQELCVKVDRTGPRQTSKVDSRSARSIDGSPGLSASLSGTLSRFAASEDGSRLAGRRGGVFGLDIAASVLPDAGGREQRWQLWQINEQWTFWLPPLK